MRGKRFRLSLLLGLTPLITFCGLHAQTLAVEPVNLFFLPGQKIVTLTLKNPASEPITVQGRAFTWAQEGNADPLNATDAILISPPMATIRPGESQVVRVAMRQPASERESTYRLLIDQLPSAARPKEVSILLRLSIPVFVEADVHATAKFEFRVEHHRDGKSILIVANNGQIHDSVRDIHLKTSDGSVWKAVVPGLPYVLAGAERRWPIVPEGTAHAMPHEFSLTAQTDSGALVRQVSVTEEP
ncbi:P pilus assembly protein, chaperone PapD [Terriglobus roseus DSM 18391]|uniref:P pilus assembly protein, chaperone PapD n=1 Tax=Terriglobus roseus (strain DSM 18391 / NRRL B-41598 / KBS 63) TaxID=926566 RepID=I3ZK18_TERRK|nr:P pilus assembly protein, chaperone PapD [Terriglobus roseus DSM 18391]